MCLCTATNLTPVVLYCMNLSFRENRQKVQLPSLVTLILPVQNKKTHIPSLRVSLCAACRLSAKKKTHTHTTRESVVGPGVPACRRVFSIFDLYYFLFSFDSLFPALSPIVTVCHNLPSLCSTRVVQSNVYENVLNEKTPPTHFLGSATPSSRPGRNTHTNSGLQTCGR